MTTAQPIPPNPEPFAGPHDWAETFRAFTLQHLVVAVACFGVMLALCALGRRLTRPEVLGARGRMLTESWLRLGWCVSIILWQSGAVLWWVLPENFRLESSLPLHLCDVAAWVAPAALLTRNRWLRGLLYFWGIGLSTQAFFTPVLREGHADPEFWLFWVGHTQIVGSAAYDVVAGGFRPTLRDLGRALVVGVGYAGSMFVFNGACGLNYGYVGPTRPEARTILDALGPWPGRALWLVLIACLAQGLAWVPWGLASWLRGRAGPRPGPPPV